MKKAKNGKQSIPQECPPRPGYTNGEKPIPAEIYPVIDTDLGRDNVENHMSAADLQDL